MPKQKISILPETLERSFENFGKLGAKTTKDAVKEVAQIFDVREVVGKFTPLKIFFTETSSKERSNGQLKGATKLDFAKLDAAYKADDQKKIKEEQARLQALSGGKTKEQQELEKMRVRLFRLVKSDEEKTIMIRKQEEEERKRKLLMEEEEKKKKEEERQKQLQVLPEPKGKKYKSIFAVHKKKAQQLHPETKPSVGKN